MGTLCEGLNHLSRDEARQRYEQRLREQCKSTMPLSHDQGGFAGEAQDSDWLDNLDQEAWECMISGPDDSPFD